MRLVETSPSSSPAQDTALSRRRHRFKSGRGRQISERPLFTRKVAFFWCSLLDSESVSKRFSVIWRALRKKLKYKYTCRGLMPYALPGLSQCSPLTPEGGRTRFAPARNGMFTISSLTKQNCPYPASAISFSFFKSSFPLPRIGRHSTPM